MNFIVVSTLTLMWKRLKLLLGNYPNSTLELTRMCNDRSQSKIHIFGYRTRTQRFIKVYDRILLVEDRIVSIL